MPKIKLFCFPYAGGSANIYHSWKQYIGKDIELIPVELAGRGRRIGDDSYLDVYEMIEDVLGIVNKDIENGDYAFFGHSLGAYIAYLLCKEISKRDQSQPLHLFVSGRGAPHIKREEDKKYHLLDDADFKKRVEKLGGTPPGFFDHPELVEMFLPLLKNDFKLSESEIIEHPIVPLKQAITGFFGKDEELVPQQRDEWNLHTESTLDTHYFDGGHFFIHQQIEKITEIINLTLLTKYTQKTSSKR